MYKEDGVFDVGYFYDGRKLTEPIYNAVEVTGFGDAINLGDELKKLIQSYGLEAKFGYYINGIKNYRAQLMQTRQTWIEYSSADWVKNTLYKDTKCYAPSVGDVYIFALKDKGLYVAKNGSTYKKLA